MPPTVERAQCPPLGFGATVSSQRASSSQVAPPALRSNSSRTIGAASASITRWESTTPWPRPFGVGSVKR